MQRLECRAGPTGRSVPAPLTVRQYPTRFRSSFPLCPLLNLCALCVAAFPGGATLRERRSKPTSTPTAAHPVRGSYSRVTSTREQCFRADPLRSITPYRARHRANVPRSEGPRMLSPNAQAAGARPRASRGGPALPRIPEYARVFVWRTISRGLPWEEEGISRSALEASRRAATSRHINRRGPP